MSKIKAKRILGACIIASVFIGIFVPAMYEMGFWRIAGVIAAAVLGAVLIWAGMELIASS
jgi:xanthine/uracil permease